MKKIKKATVLLSGGQDSATCLAIALKECETVNTLCFDYGQRHRNEIDCARQLANRANVSFKLIDLSLLSQLTQNALTDSSIPIERIDGALPNTFVPGRNHLFLSVAAIAAYQQGIRDLYTGVCQTDFSGYPDCRQTFVSSLEKTISLSMDTAFRIHTPLMFLSKSETVLKMKSLGCLAWYQDTLTCYEGHQPACGVCPSCQLRLKGFEDAGCKDLIPYESC